MWELVGEELGGGGGASQVSIFYTINTLFGNFTFLHGSHYLELLHGSHYLEILHGSHY